MTVPPRSQQVTVRAFQRRIPACRNIDIASLLQSTIPRPQDKMQHSSHDNTHATKRHVRDIRLPVPRPLRRGIKVAGVDRRKIGPGVHDCVRDRALRTRSRERRRHPGQNASERAVDGHHHECRDIPRGYVQRDRADDEANAAEYLGPDYVQPALTDVVAVERVEHAQDGGEDVRRGRQ